MKNNTNRRGIRAAWIAAGLAAFVIFCFSAQPNSAQFTAEIFGEHNALARHAAHVTEFAIFFLVLRWALNRTLTRIPGWVLSMVAFVACGVYAFIDEWHQTFVPGRSPSIDDVERDVIGVTISLLIWLVVGGLRRLFKRRTD